LEFALDGLKSGEELFYKIFLKKLLTSHDQTEILEHITNTVHVHVTGFRSQSRSFADGVRAECSPTHKYERAMDKTISAKTSSLESWIDDALGMANQQVQMKIPRRFEYSRGETMVRAVYMLLLCLFAFHEFAAAEDPGRVELSQNWALASAKEMQAEGATVSQPGYQVQGWHPIRRMPATVLEVLQEDGVYPDLYVGKNMLEKVPQDLYKQDWWYRTEFTAPAGFSNYTLQFPGINYRAEIWVNGQKVADSKQIVGMYVAHELNVTRWIRPGSLNALAVKVTPETRIQDVDGVELADSWFDWINWKYLGYKGELSKPHQFGVSFVPDRNAGIWKPVYLRATGEVTVENPAVNTDLSVPQSLARLSVYANLHSYADRPVTGTLRGTIFRRGKPTVAFEQSVSLSPGETREVLFAPDKYPDLVVQNPDLWWPYTMGDPALYNLHLEFVAGQKLSDHADIHFGIRSVTQHRDQDQEFADKGKGGNFYLQVNGRDFLVRGADYTPDLLYKYDPDREAAILQYVKDLGLNMLRSESKISSEHLAELADEQGIPLVFGWMCCNQWEKWDQWSEEDHLVAPESLRSQILMLRPHASSFIWANGSDGLPPVPVRDEYHRILSELHWQNTTVDTVSSFAKDDKGERIWDGILMEGPYSWRPPAYWFSGKYPTTRGSSAEQGDNEHIPTLESLRKFIPVDKLWPINDTWFFHAGSIQNSNELKNIQQAVNRRYGPSSSVEEFVRKAQLAHYENTRAQFEDFAAGGWANHKMTMYWMLNSHWPSFYGNIIDYYLSPGGTYYGAKKGLQPLSVVFDAYATGDRRQAKIIVVNQTSGRVKALHVRVYDLSGKVIDDRSIEGVQLPFNSSSQVLTLPRYPQASPVFFVRCQLFDEAGRVAVDNTYWQSQTDDDLGDRKNDDSFHLKQVSWADMTALNTLSPVQLEVSAEQTVHYSERVSIIRLHNPTSHIAFFERASICTARDGDEILPVQYDDNYVTVFPGETVEIHGSVSKDAAPQWVKLEGFNTPATSVKIE
jgi:exo-1,4-beta-D-glucosaminidase